MPTNTPTLEEELGQIEQAIKQGVITPQEGMKVARDMVEQAESQQMQPAIPRALDPRLDEVIATPYQGPDGFGGAVEGAVKEGGKTALAVWLGKVGLERIVPMVYDTGATSKEAGEAIKAIKKLKTEDIEKLPAAAQEPIKAAQAYLKKNWGRSKAETGEAAVEALRGAQAAMEKAVSESLGNLSTGGVKISSLASEVKVAVGHVSGFHQGAVEQIKGAIADGAATDFVGKLNVATSTINDFAQPAVNGIAGKAHEIEGLGTSILNNSKAGTASHKAIEVLEQAEQAVQHRLGDFHLNGAAKNLLIGTVAAAVLVGAYRGYRSAHDAKQTHEELQRTAAGTREDFAGLYNQNHDMAIALSQADMRPTVVNAPYAVIPSGVVPDAMVSQPAMQGQGVPLLAPAAAASRAEMLDYQRTLAAQQTGAPAMN